MKFLTYVEHGRDMVGVLSPDGDRVFSLIGLGYPFSRMEELIADYSQELRGAIRQKISMGAEGIPLEHVELAAPIPHPYHDLLCVGLNFLPHALESCRFKGIEYKKPDYPTYFSKRVNRAVAPGQPILSHSDISDKLDYEAELAVVIGKRCDHVPPAEVFDSIFGYTIVNDVSTRDLQTRHGGQFAFSKSLDGLTPMGPWIVTRDEFSDPPHLRLQSRVNGEPRQDGNSSDFIFDIPYLVSDLSAGIVLQPGDILITGTPSGVAMGMEPPKFLKPGDVVECEVEGIGVLRNPVI